MHARRTVLGEAVEQRLDLAGGVAAGLKAVIGGARQAARTGHGNMYTVRV